MNKITTKKTMNLIECMIEKGVVVTGIERIEGLLTNMKNDEFQAVVGLIIQGRSSGILFHMDQVKTNINMLAESLVVMGFCPDEVNSIINNLARSSGTKKIYFSNDIESVIKIR